MRFFYCQSVAFPAFQKYNHLQGWQEITLYRLFTCTEHCGSVFEVSRLPSFFIVVFSVSLTFLVALELNHNYWVPQTCLFACVSKVSDEGLRMLKNYFL